MNITLSNERFGHLGTYDIPNEFYELLQKMHPVRTEEALQSLLNVDYRGVSVTEEQICLTILKEAETLEKLPQLIKRARDEYSNFSMNS